MHRDNRSVIATDPELQSKLQQQQAEIDDTFQMLQPLKKASTLLMQKCNEVQDSHARTVRDQIELRERLQAQAQAKCAARQPIRRADALRAPHFNFVVALRSWRQMDDRTSMIAPDRWLE